jgi:protein-tyrosine phosphatase
LPELQCRIALEGAVNFRDLGGYATTDHRRVRRGRVFRSDQLAELSAADLRTVAALGLRTLCDFRADSERAQKPNRQLMDPAPATHAVGFMPRGGEVLMAGAKGLAVAAIEQAVTAIYRDFVRNRIPNYTRLFELMLAADAFPLLIHCTSGRDRTGFAAVLLLSALGVPREIIAADYVLSDRYRRDIAFQLGSGVDPKVMAAITRSHPAYLDAVFEEIDRGWGGMDVYLREALKLSDQARAYLRAELLENGSDPFEFQPDLS